MHITLVRQDTRARCRPEMKSNLVHRCLAKTAVAALLAISFAAVQAQSVEARMLSTLPVAVSIAAPVVLSAAGAAIAFIPNEIGAALLYNERVTR